MNGRSRKQDSGSSPGILQSRLRKISNITGKTIGRIGTTTAGASGLCAESNPVVPSFIPYVYRLPLMIQRMPTERRLYPVHMIAF